MRNSARLPMHFPLGSKYVLESHGPFVRRYIEFPNGHRVQLPKSGVIRMLGPYFALDLWVQRSPHEIGLSPRSAGM